MALALLTLLAISVLLIVRGIRDPDEIGGATVGVLTLVGMAAMTFMTGNEPARSPEDDSHNGTVDQ